jgi:hypothetical protein
VGIELEEESGQNEASPTAELETKNIVICSENTSAVGALLDRSIYLLRLYPVKSDRDMLLL